MVFVDSMSDLFHEDVTDEQIAAVFGVMAACSQHTFQILTKRPARMRAWFELPGITDLVENFCQVAVAGRIEDRFADERQLPISGWPGYFVTSHGRILATIGNESCGWCGATAAGSIRKRFCSGRCRSKAHYEQQQGRWSAPEPAAKEMAVDVGEQGHARVTLRRADNEQRFFVHRLVLETFDRPARSDEQGCHIDGDATNNALWNLRWGTQSQNWDDSKRHGTRRRYSKLTDEQVMELRRMAACGMNSAELGRRFGISDTQARNIISGRQWSPQAAMQWPLPWVWVGVSVENQDTADERIPQLLDTLAAVRFLSCEPLLGPLRLHEDGLDWLTSDHCRGIDWVIAGCESGPSARDCSVQWLRWIRDQCAMAHVPFFLKQASVRGSEALGGPLITLGANSRRKGGGIIELPYLDGSQHAEFPTLEAADR
jgi:protein gp37